MIINKQNNPEFFFLWLRLIFSLIFACYSELLLFYARGTGRMLFFVSHLGRSRNTLSRSNNFSLLQSVSSMFQYYLCSEKDCEPGIKKFMFSGKQSVGASEYIMEHIIIIFNIFLLFILQPVIILLAIAGV